jgi:hypothetical protein
MTDESDSHIAHTGKISRIVGQADVTQPASESDGLKGELTLPTEAVRLLTQQLIEMTASVGPDPETAKIIAETERHAEEKKLEGYKATLELRDHQSQRDQEYRLEQLKHSASERRIVLFGSLAALVVGGILSLKGDPLLGNPVMSAALTILITLLTGKLKTGE